MEAAGSPLSAQLAACRSRGAAERSSTRIAGREQQRERGRSQPTAEMEAFNLHNREAD